MAVTSFVQSEFDTTVGCRPASSGGRSSVASADVDLLERVHHALADAARRHVDHAPQRHVVMRVQDELEIRQRVLDFLALVETDAAEHDVGDVGLAQRRLRPTRDCALVR